NTKALPIRPTRWFSILAGQRWDRLLQDWSSRSAPTGGTPMPSLSQRRFTAFPLSIIISFSAKENWQKRKKNGSRIEPFFLVLFIFFLLMSNGQAGMLRQPNRLPYSYAY